MKKLWVIGFLSLRLLAVPLWADEPTQPVHKVHHHKKKTRKKAVVKKKKGSFYKSSNIDGKAHYHFDSRGNPIIPHPKKKRKKIAHHAGRKNKIAIRKETSSPQTTPHLSQQPASAEGMSAGGSVQSQQSDSQNSPEQPTQSVLPQTQQPHSGSDSGQSGEDSEQETP